MSAEQESPADWVMLPTKLDQELTWILGRPNFACAPIFRALRAAGYSIETHAEEEQAASIHWMLMLYAKHGPEHWREEGEKQLKEMYAASREKKS